MTEDNSNNHNEFFISNINKTDNINENEDKNYSDIEYDLKLDKVNGECTSNSFDPLNPIKNNVNNLNYYKNINKVLENAEENEIAYHELMAGFTLENMDMNFTSRDLVKIFLFLIKNKNQENYKNELSMKGIRFWESISKIKRYEFLFKRYKPWTLHTSFKRLFTNSDINEVVKLMTENTDADLSWLLKTLYTSKKKKQKITKKFLQKKVRRNKSEEVSLGNHSDKDDSFNIVIDNDFDENFEVDYESENNKEIKCNFTNFLDEKIFKSKFSEYFNQQKEFKFDHLIDKSNFKNSNNYKDNLSDLYDNENNLKANKILTVDYKRFKETYYLTVVNHSDIVIRKFYNNSKNGADVNKNNNILEIIKNVKNEFNNENESKIIEIMMRVSNDELDLKLYLSDPLKNQGICIN